MCEGEQEDTRRQMTEGLESHSKGLIGLDSLSRHVDSTEGLQDIDML